MQHADPHALSERARLGPHAQHPWIVFVAPARPGTTSGAEAVSRPAPAATTDSWGTWRTCGAPRGGRAAGRNDGKRTAWHAADDLSGADVVRLAESGLAWLVCVPC
jgi:hypothetical protein